MTRLTLLLTGIALSLAADKVAAEVVVVISSQTDVESLNESIIENIFLGRRESLPDGTRAVPVDLPEGSAERIAFYATLLDMSEAQVKAHWARLIFTGRGRPPRVVDDSKALLDWLSRNPGSVGYLDRSLVDERVRVVYPPAAGGGAPSSNRTIPAGSGADES